MEILSHSPEETKKLAGELIKNIKEGQTIALYGDLGSGKTTFTRYLVEALGIKCRVQSPTFVLMRKYSDNGLNSRIKSINHIDLYRINSIEEVLDLGFREIIEEKDSISIIEWPEIVENLLPDSTIRIYFYYSGENERRIKILNLH
ncbi:MAG TPA: tRNA (adenosine(37)-N6)-threonylcarbamoyltransferase complex ATPase subunit type 1 TsaE [bacterium]|jgi:tRNA threonylcarbamoyladenosine biosynthesis protein TsaE|nr:tRNA (adenosine(37)-N6)-threonylcarbamoyltransferase complex ATPase subunit type 1 TsaE [bacterium]HOA18565.1 tRNA (adenosine(37)-N6)-threonylcarbamoyltransferase complex ATPase subunit type 1 TsaE [bacterium]